MFSRRDLIRLAGVFGAGRLFGAADAAAAPAPAHAWAAGAAIDEPIGEPPLLNGRGTITVNGGSIELPEVRAAKDAANQRHVQLDELMEAVGRRLAELTGAEWGMVSAGCAAAMSHATAACIA